MKLTVIGAGNIGLVTALCFAKKGHQVYCVDIDHTKIAQLKSGTTTIFEPKLDSLLVSQLNTKNIEFSTELKDFINQSDVIFITIGTPNRPNGQVDLTALEAAIENISNLTQSTKTLVIKSTVPPNTNNRLSEKYPNLIFISSPEFLREGSAVSDCLNPDRIIVGSQAKNLNDDLMLFKKIYAPFNLGEEKFLQMDSTTAEITKYAANIFLAARISLINEFSRVCEKSGADIELLKHGIGLDQRIGPEFLNAGIGYGGSCFPKDIDAFLNYATDMGENLSITKAVKDTNESQIKNFTDKIINYFSSVNEATARPTICIWGTAFKPETDDLREAPALKLINYLLAANFKLNLFDPKTHDQLLKLFKDNKNIQIFKNSFDALKGTDALVIPTEWSEFKTASLNEIKNLLKKPVVFDGRNIFSVVQMHELGFKYFSVGRQ